MCPVLDNFLSSTLVQASSFYVMNYHNRLNWSHPLPTFTHYSQSIFYKGPGVIFILYKSECIIPLLATYQCLLFTPLFLVYEFQHGRLLSFSSSTSHTVFLPVKHYTGLLSILEHIKLFFTLEPLDINIPWNKFTTTLCLVVTFSSPQNVSFFERPSQTTHWFLKMYHIYIFISCFTCWSSDSHIKA